MRCENNAADLDTFRKQGELWAPVTWEGNPEVTKAGHRVQGQTPVSSPGYWDSNPRAAGSGPQNIRAYGDTTIVSSFVSFSVSFSFSIFFLLLRLLLLFIVIVLLLFLFSLFLSPLLPELRNERHRCNAVVRASFSQ